MPIDERFIAEVAAHIIALEQATPDESWSRYDRRHATRAYIEQQMNAGSAIARAHWHLEGSAYDELLDEIAERGYQARLTHIHAELGENKPHDRSTASINAQVDSGTIPPRVYDAYHLAYNNVTYRAVRDALDEAAEISGRGNGKITETFIVETMNLLIDASFERLGAVLYQGAEAKLLTLLRPLASNLTGLALRHLSNFGVSPMPATPTPLYLLIKELSIARADLSASTQDARQLDNYKARIAAEWLKAATLLIGTAADLLADVQSPGTTWRHGAQDKLTTAFFTLKHGIETMLDEDYTPPPKLGDAVLQMLDVLPVPLHPFPKNK